MVKPAVDKKGAKKSIDGMEKLSRRGGRQTLRSNNRQKEEREKKTKVVATNMKRAVELSATLREEEKGKGKGRVNRRG
jgi:hypothetical protein